MSLLQEMTGDGELSVLYTMAVWQKMIHEKRGEKIQDYTWDKSTEREEWRKYKLLGP